MTAVERPARQDTEATRLRLLEAGRELLRTRGSLEHVDIKLRDACDQAGYSTGAAYPIFNSQPEYQAELARFVASSFDWAGPSLFGDQLAEIIASAEDHVEAIRRSTQLYLSQFVEQDDFYLALRFWSVRSPSTEMADALSEGYRVVHDEFVELFTGLLAVYGLQLRPPATIDQVTMILTAIAEGLALRHRIDPDAVEASFPAIDGNPTTLFAEAMVAVTAHFTEPIPDPD